TASALLFELGKALPATSSAVTDSDTVILPFHWTPSIWNSDREHRQRPFEVLLCAHAPGPVAQTPTIRACSAPAIAELPRPLLGRVRPASRAAAQSLVVATAAKFEFSTVINVVYAVSASAKPASLAMLIAPVASLRTSVLIPSPAPSTAEARTQLFVMYPTSVTVSTFLSRSHWAT